MFWKKKKIDTESAVVKETPIICNHKWKDFPWYITGTFAYDKSHWNCKIIEPYVCIYCGQRQDKLLQEYDRYNLTMEEADNYLQGVRDEFKDYCKPRAIVEDMINDFKLVDPATLYYYELLHKSTPKTRTTTPDRSN